MKMFFALAIFLSLFVHSLGQKTHDKQVWKNSASIAICTSAKVTPKCGDRKGIPGIPAYPDIIGDGHQFHKFYWFHFPNAQ